MRTSLKLAAAVAALALVSTTAGAQTTRGGRTVRQQGQPAAQQGSSAMPLELGIDGDISFNFTDGDDATVISLPNAIFRMAFHRNATWAIEPYGSIQRLGTDDFSTRTIILGAGLIYHLSPSRSVNQWYVRPFLGLHNESTTIDLGTGDQTESSTQFQLGGGFGLRMPMSDRLGARFEALLARTLEDGDQAGFTTLGLRAGFSYFTR
jgi:hypothetical protein